MDELPSKIGTPAPGLLSISADKTGINLQPDLWEAAEAFTSPNLAIRCEGFKILASAEAVRNHPLVAYLLFSRLAEPDIELRARIVSALASALTSDGTFTPEMLPVYAGLSSWLSDLRTRQIYALLQVVEFDRNTEPAVAGLLEQCSYAGEHLSEILANRQMALSMRKLAAHYIGRLGYLDALPVLERLATKLAQRRSGREEYGDFDLDSDECALLPLIQNALVVLNAP